jgi:hypothetical protein
VRVFFFFFCLGPMEVFCLCLWYILICKLIVRLSRPQQMARFWFA